MTSLTNHSALFQHRINNAFAQTFLWDRVRIQSREIVALRLKIFSDTFFKKFYNGDGFAIKNRSSFCKASTLSLALSLSLLLSLRYSHTHPILPNPLFLFANPFRALKTLITRYNVLFHSLTLTFTISFSLAYKWTLSLYFTISLSLFLTHIHTLDLFLSFSLSLSFFLSLSLAHKWILSH